jgi:transposase
MVTNEEWLRRGVDPLDYIRDVLSRLPKMTTRDDLTALLPAAWKPVVS